MLRMNATKKYQELPAYQRGSCACCAYLEAEFVCNLGYHLRCHKAGQPLSLHTLFMQPRPKHQMAKAFPTLTPKAGRDATLDEVWEWHFPEPNSTEPRHTPAKFLSMFTTLAMNAAYPDGTWHRQFSDVKIPKLLGERSIKRGAVQDAMLMANHPSDMIGFADHNDVETNAIYNMKAQMATQQINHTLDLPVDEILPQGKAFSPMDVLIEMKAVQRDMTALVAGLMAPVVDLSHKTLAISCANASMLSLVHT